MVITVVRDCPRGSTSDAPEWFSHPSREGDQLSQLLFLRAALRSCVMLLASLFQSAWIGIAGGLQGPLPTKRRILIMSHIDSMIVEEEKAIGQIGRLADHLLEDTTAVDVHHPEIAHAPVPIPGYRLAEDMGDLEVARLPTTGAVLEPHPFRTEVMVLLPTVGGGPLREDFRRAGTAGFDHPLRPGDLDLPTVRTDLATSLEVVAARDGHGVEHQEVKIFERAGGLLLQLPVTIDPQEGPHPEPSPLPLSAQRVPLMASAENSPQA